MSSAQTKTIKVRGITCMDCVTHIAQGVRRLPGVQKVSGNLDQGSVKVVFDAEKVPVEEILRAIEGTGYTVVGIEG